jgi:hypothetical protein
MTRAFASTEQHKNLGEKSFVLFRPKFLIPYLTMGAVEQIKKANRVEPARLGGVKYLLPQAQAFSKCRQASCGKSSCIVGIFGAMKAAQNEWNA